MPGSAPAIARQRAFTREEVDVRRGLADDGQLPSRAGGGVEPKDLVARDGEHPERVRVAEVVLARERECFATAAARAERLSFRLVDHGGIFAL
jgi:hypothetical protein